ncbi:MAG: F0F1 ATP synthase subunit B [Planctomycetota bacterium]
MALATVLLTALMSEEGRGLGALLDFAPGATLWTWIAFLVALPFMWKFVYGPITKALEDRDRKVDEAIEAADAAQKKAEEQMRAAQAELDKARAESRRLVEEAVARAEKQAAEAQRQAEERQKIELQKAREAIEAEKRQALLEIRQHVVALTISATSRLLQQDVDDQKHRQMVDAFVAASEGSR